MGKAAERVSRRHTASPSRKCDWRRGMSNNVAYALLIYTGLQIFVTVAAMERGLNSMLPYFALVILVVGIIPACRFFERRWIRLSDEQAADRSLAPTYRRDQLGLWALVIGLPFALTALFKALAT